MSDIPRLPEPLPDLEGELLRLVQQIPPGRVTTYGTLAEALGSRAASRWVGRQLLGHPHTETCTCHRVVRAGGELGGYGGGGAAKKRRRLRREGIRVAQGRVSLARHGYTEFCASRPLEALADWQSQLRQRVVTRNELGALASVGGVDVSYAGDQRAAAAYAQVAWSGGELLGSSTCRGVVRFPYVPSFLAFRELPLLLELVAAVRAQGQLADVLLVDGAGILHPRRMGIATMLGVLAGVPTIGVTKKRLWGRVDLARLHPDRPQRVMDGEEWLGVALLPRHAKSRPLYVSPGHRVDVQMACDLARQLLHDHRLPEPIFWADRLSRAAARAATAPAGAG